MKKSLLELNGDAFSHGQITSKLWLCEKLEETLAMIESERPPVIWVFGGWYGLLPFLLFSRGKSAITKIVLFDKDAHAVAASLRINDAWRFTNHFQAFCIDVNEPIAASFGEKPQVVINTSCEHFDLRDWWKQIPEHTLVVLQSTNMHHPEHVSPVASVIELRESFAPWAKVHLEDQIDVQYASFGFSRFMVIGEKGGALSS